MKLLLLRQRSEMDRPTDSISVSPVCDVTGRYPIFRRIGAVAIPARPARPARPPRNEAAAASSFLGLERQREGGLHDLLVK